MTNPAPDGGNPCAAELLLGGEKAAQTKALCEGALLDLANGDWGSRTDASAFENRVIALRVGIEEWLTEAQSIASDFS